VQKKKAVMSSDDLELGLPIFLERLRRSLSLVAELLGSLPDDRAGKAAGWISELIAELGPFVLEAQRQATARQDARFES
jgi:hypothetical protein